MSSWPYCATLARRRDDPLAGTAAPASRWLLVEYAGPWAVQALHSGELRGAVATELRRAAASVAGRVLLIRRPGRRRTGSGPQSWAVVDHYGGQEWGTWSAADDLSRAAEAMRRGPVQQPDRPAQDVLLVCTHGLHDVCCAVRGRPVARALAARWPQSTWECTHVGGDRFAANLLVVPDGTCYGSLDPESAVDVVQRHLLGTLAAEHFRGVSTEPPVIQAAIGAALEAYGTVGPGSLRGRSTVRTGPESWLVTLAGASPLPTSIDVAVTRRRRQEAVLTCRAGTATAAYAYEAALVRRP
ncbi:sucrase ferredoxin [Pedococcus sp. 5OH_020]|uniref:sucrase ferredoxin n=1 Tax=Pedococcus sp. 5OH_020 TaxID=2989814 RepID=UPI0022E9C381|nr:sucrase ferredoxin [Pedococcus sp. 5OH_020]